MTYSFQVEFEVRKGTGPEYETKVVPIAYDDVDPVIPVGQIKQTAITEAEQWLRLHDCPVSIFVDIFDC